MDLNTGTIIIHTRRSRHYRYYVTRVQTSGPRDYYWAIRINKNNVIRGNEKVVCDSVEIQKEWSPYYGYKVEEETG